MGTDTKEIESKTEAIPNLNFERESLNTNRDNEANNFDSLDPEVREKLLYFVDKKYSFKNLNMGRPTKPLTKNFYISLLRYYESPILDRYSLEMFAKDYNLPKTTLISIIKREEFKLLKQLSKEKLF
jgi:hypothetical protein